MSLFPRPLGAARVWRVAAAFATTSCVMMFAACGGERGDATGDETGAAAPAVAGDGPRDACALLPAAEVQAVVGQPATDSLALSMPSDQSPPTLSQCNYDVAGEIAGASLLVRRPIGGWAPTEARDRLREEVTALGGTVEDVPGLGAAAAWTVNQLHVFTEEGWYLIVSPARDGGLPQARALMERALGRF